VPIGHSNGCAKLHHPNTPTGAKPAVADNPIADYACNS